MRKREEEERLHLKEQKERDAARRQDEADRKIIIPLNEDSSSDDSSSDSEVSLSDVEDLKGDVTNPANGTSEATEPEPTFIVTMDGIDEQYFKQKQKEGATAAAAAVAAANTNSSTAAVTNEQAAPHVSKSATKSTKKQKPTQPPEKPVKVEQKQAPKVLPKKAPKVFPRDSPDDGALELHSQENFDSPGQSPKHISENNLKETNKVLASSATERKVDKSPAKSNTVHSNHKPVAKPIKAMPNVKSPTAEAKPVTKLATVPQTTKTTIGNTSAHAKLAVKKVAAVKPSVSKLSASDAKTTNASSDQKTTAVKVKPKFTPITAPEQDSKPSTVISLKPKMRIAPTVVNAPLLSASIAPRGSISAGICKYYPNCLRANQCFFYHPPQPSEALTRSKFKWTAR